MSFEPTFSPGERRVLKLLAADKPLVPRRDWVDCMSLVRRGYVKARKAPNGQVEICGLTDSGREQV